MAKQSTEIDSTSVGYDRMRQFWPLLHDLLGGTDAMRAAGELWLPREPKEEADAYQIRLQRSILYNGLESAIDRLVSKPFARPVQLVGELPSRLKGLEDNTDAEGTDLTQFGRDVFDSMVTYGLTHVLTDYSQATGDETLEQEKEQGLRPFFIHIRPPKLVRWITKAGPGGVHILDEIRYYETRVETVDGIEVELDYIRVYTTTGWSLWKPVKNEQGKVAYVTIDSGEHTAGKVPLTTIYASRCGFMVGKPPLINLAWLNVAHWQSMSDQRNILRYARAAILLATGFASKEIDEIIISPTRVIRSTNKEAKLIFVEHSGRALEAGQADLVATEERMEVLGLQPMVQRTAQSTATGKTIDERQIETIIQSWVRSLERGLRECIVQAAAWVNEEVDEKFAVNVFNDFGIADYVETDIDMLLKLRSAVPPQISHETLIRELRKRGSLSDDVQAEIERARIDEEDWAPPLTPPEDDEDENENEDEDETSDAD